LALVESIQTKLSIKTKPSGADIFLNGEKIGRTPFVVKKIEPGIQFLALSKKGYQDVDRKIFIKKNETTKIFETMKIQMGELSITATPSGAGIYLDNKYLGTSPKSLSNVPAGNHKLRISLSKYKDYIEDFILAHDEYKTVDVKLESLPGKLDLTAPDKGAIVYIDGKKKGTSPIIIALKPGSHALEVQLPGYRKHKQKINIASDETLKIYTSLEKIRTGSIQVTTDPPGAQVFVDSQPMGKTPVTIPTLEVKKYNILLNLLGYETITSMVEVEDGKTVKLHKKLKIKSGILKLSTAPAKARVEIDNSIVGYTPVEIDVPVGSHILKVSKENYQVWETTFVIDYQDEKEIRHTLEPIPGMLTVVAEPTGADISINGEPQTSKTIILKPGRYTVRVSHEGYRPMKKVVKIGLNESAKLSFKLEEINQGVLLVSTIPPDAEIYLNGELKGKSPTNFPEINVGKHLVRISKKGFKPIEKMVTIYKNQSTEIIEELAPQTGMLFVKVFPPDAEIHLDNKYLGTSPQLARNLVIGKHEVRFTHENYTDWVEEVMIEPDSQKRLNINLEKLPGEVFVFSSPSGGDIYVNGQFKGKTNTLIKLEPGNYKIKVLKTGYYEYYKDVTVPSGRQISLDYHLMEQGAGTLLITTKPSGAQVFLNGEFFGQTPLEKKYLKAASHSILIIKDGYKSITDSISIGKGEKLKLNYDLSSVWGTLKVVTEPDKTLIYLDEEFLGQGPGVFEKLPVGWHRIKVTHENFREWTGKVKLKPDETESILIKLEPLPGDVSIYSTPAESSVFIKDKKVGQTPLTISLIPGPYSIRLEKEGYIEEDLPLELPPGSKKTFNVTLIKKKILRLGKLETTAIEEPIKTVTVKKKLFPNPLLNKSPLFLLVLSPISRVLC
jgi:uncharacterized membrane protein